MEASYSNAPENKSESSSPGKYDYNFLIIAINSFARQ